MILCSLIGQLSNLSGHGMEMRWGARLDQNRSMTQRHTVRIWTSDLPSASPSSASPSSSPSLPSTKSDILGLRAIFSMVGILGLIQPTFHLTHPEMATRDVT